MNNDSRTLVSRLLAAGLPLLMLPAVVQAQFAYTFNNSAITITGYSGPGGALCLTNGVFYFSDPNRTYYPARNYRIRSS